MKKNYNKTVVLLVLSMCISSLTFAQIIADGTYKIFNAVNSEVMTVNTIPQPNPQDVIVGRAIMATPDDSDNLQLWTFTHQGSDIYKIENDGDNTYLGVKDGWCGQFGDVQVGFTETSPYTLIKVSAASAADTYVFEIAFDADCNFGSTNDPIKAFDIDGGNSEAKLQTFDIDITNPNQQFQIVEPSALSIEEPSQALSAVDLIYNSTNRSVSVMMNQNISITKLEIFDINGRLIATHKAIGSEDVQLDFTAQANGIYLIKMASTEAQVVKKLVVY